MKPCLLFALLAAMAAAQSTTVRYETDINGRRIESASSGRGDGSSTEHLRSVNGKQVPTEQAEEKVISESASSKITERVIRKYDRNGQVSSAERVRVEEEKSPGGGVTVHQTTWRSDINGRMNESERRTTESRVSGSTTTTDVSVSRLTINGGFETAEKRSIVKEKLGDSEQSNEIVQRRGGDGRFYDAIREVANSKKSGDRTTEERAVYEPGVTGALELSRQSVTTSTKRPDGGEVTELNLYARSPGGQAQSRGGAPQIKEQQIIERTRAADGTVVESISVRRPVVGDSDRLGSAQKVAETICTGVCK